MLNVVHDGIRAHAAAEARRQLDPPLGMEKGGPELLCEGDEGRRPAEKEFLME